MLTTEHPWSAATPVSDPPTTYALRLHGGTEDDRLLSVPPGKHSIGSGPRSSLRLQNEGVQPLECLIVRDETGLRVRRWSDTTLVNGQPFDDVQLTPGDVLTIGLLELEVVATESAKDFTQDELWQLEHGKATWSMSGDYAGKATINDHFDGRGCRAADTPVARGDEFERRAVAVARRRSRQVLAALRSQRREHDELLGRVDDLVRKVEHVLTERPLAPASEDERPTERVAAEVAHEAVAQVQTLTAELGTVRKQLTTRDAELGQARYSIDVLERQLIDSQHTLHAFVEERVSWESQLNELEARLAEYVGQIQFLEQQLDQIRTAPAEAESSPPNPTVRHAAEESSTDAASHEPFDEQPVVVEEPPTDESWHEESAAEITVQQTPAADTVDEVATGAATGPVEPLVVDEGAPEDAAQVDAALEHLRGLSIWREEAQSAAETGDAEATPPAANASAAAKVAESESFIDRYAHLFPPEDSTETPPAAATPPVALSPVAEPRAEVHGESHAGAHADEESVEQYMARLLERMRGPSNKPVDENGAAAQIAEGESPAAAAVSTAAEEASPNQDRITHVEELRSKISAPERTSDIAAMRALANQSARHAIGMHTAKRLRHSARTRTVIALLGAAVGIYLLLDAPGWKSLQFIAGCVAAIVAIYWGKLTVSTLIEGIRLRAFDDVEEDIDPAESLHPPLPIDVERAAVENSLGDQATGEIDGHAVGEKVIDEHTDERAAAAPID